MNRIFTARVIKGQLVFISQHAVSEHLNTFKNGAKVHVVIRKPQASRTLKQNRYYFGVVCKVCGDHFGYTSEEMHDAFKWKFLKKEGPIPTVQSTTQLTTTEFTDYIESIFRWAATEYNIYIPSPDEVEF